MSNTIESKYRYKRIIALLLALLWMGAIFVYSSKDGDESSLQSHKVGKLFGSIVVADWENWTPEQQEDFAATWDHPIRKGAHMTEFAILGVLVSNALYVWRGRSRRTLLWAMLFSVFYAATDEFHQTFVPGRDGKFLDVCIDSAGVLLGCLLFYALCMWIARRRNL